MDQTQKMAFSHLVKLGSKNGQKKHITVEELFWGGDDPTFLWYNQKIHDILHELAKKSGPESKN